MASSRRHFLQAAAAGAALPAAAQPARSPNDKIQFATIGIGGMGTADTMAALQAPAGTKLVAVADVYQGRLDRARERWGKDLSTTRDYREILNRKDIDAVVVSTPDHWHAQISIDALNAGKDVYVQKPMVQKIEDGIKVVEAAKRTRRILQVGSQRVSSVEYKKAQDLFRAGAIGKLNMIEAWWDRNSAMGAWQYSIPTDASPSTVDWDRFLGSAPKRPFEPMRLFRWRNYADYGTGVAGDLFVHLFSGLHFVIGATGPTRIFASGGLRFWKDGRDVPDILLGLYDYPETAAHPAFNLALRVNFVNGAGETSGFRFTGSEGVLTIGNGVSLSRTPPESKPGAPPAWDAITPAADEQWRAPRGYSDQNDHHANFFDSVRSRKPVVEDALFGLRAAAPALLSNTSFFENRICHWNPETGGLSPVSPRGHSVTVPLPSKA